jgi:hypothetical protein
VAQAGIVAKLGGIGGRLAVMHFSNGLVRLLGVIAFFVCAISCEKKIAPSRKDLGMAPNNEKNEAQSLVGTAQGATKGEMAHPVEQRKKELLDLITDVKHNQFISKNSVLKRLGKPDYVQDGWSKPFTDRIITTRFAYDLPSGEYMVPDSRQITLDLGSKAYINFDERVTHGPHGRLYSESDDKSAPVVSLTLADRYSVEHGSGGISFSTDIGEKYKASTPHWSD